MSFPPRLRLAIVPIVIAGMNVPSSYSPVSTASGIAPIPHPAVSGSHTACSRRKIRRRPSPAIRKRKSSSAMESGGFPGTTTSPCNKPTVDFASSRSPARRRSPPPIQAGKRTGILRLRERSRPRGIFHPPPRPNQEGNHKQQDAPWLNPPSTAASRPITKISI